MKEEIKKDLIFAVASYLFFAILFASVNYFRGEITDFSTLFTLKNVLSFTAFFAVWYLAFMISKLSHNERIEIRRDAE